MNPIIVLSVAAVAGSAAIYWTGRAQRRALSDAVSRLQAQLAAMAAAPVSPPPSPITPETLMAQLSNTLSLRSSEDQVLWSAFGTFWAANAILLVALFSTGKLPESPVIAPVVSGVGLAISLVWHGIQLRSLGHVERYEKLAARIEARLELEQSLSTSASRNEGDYVLYLKNSGPRARNLMKCCSALATILWAGAFVLFIRT